MKKLILFLSSFWILDASGASYGADYRISDLKLVRDGGCAISDGRINCWGTRWIDPLATSGLRNVRAIDLGPRHSCAIDDEKAVCWTVGSVRKEQKIVPLKSPRELIAFSYRVGCAIDDDGVKCWSPFYENGIGLIPNSQMARGLGTMKPEIPCAIGVGNSFECRPPEGSFKNLRKIASATTSTCALDDEGVRCWKTKTDITNPDLRITRIPKLKNPRDLVVGTEDTTKENGDFACALDDDGMKCWGASYGEVKAILIPRISNPVLLSAISRIENTQRQPMGLVRPQTMPTVCLVDDFGTRCWDSKSSAPEILTTPTSFAVSPDQICTAFQEGVQCASHNQNEGEAKSFFVPLKNPRQVVISYQQVCALHDSGVHCVDEIGQPTFDFPIQDLDSTVKIIPYGSSVIVVEKNRILKWAKEGNSDFGPWPGGPLKNIRDFAIGLDHMCLIDDEGVRCKNDPRWPQRPNLPNRPLPSFANLRNPREIAMNSLQACVLDDSGVNCFTYDTKNPIQVPVLLKPRLIKASSDEMCAVEENELKCWGKKPQIFQTELKFRDLIDFTMDNQRCALDHVGIRCWGAVAWTPLGTPIYPITPFYPISHSTINQQPFFQLDDLNDYFALLLKTSSLGRANYFQDLANFERQHFWHRTRSRATSESRYLLLQLAIPAIATNDSNYYRETLIPGLEKSRRLIDQDLGFSNDITQVGDSLQNRQIIMTSIKSALKVAVNFLSPPDQALIQETLRLVGQAFADPGDLAKIQRVSSALHSIEPSLENLERSSKTTFIVQSLHLATTWLEQVK